MGESPYKIVKSRSKIEGNEEAQLFGLWQTEDFRRPEAKNGTVPRNKYGTVDLFQRNMLPIGTVHLTEPEMGWYTSSWVTTMSATCLPCRLIPRPRGINAQD